MRWSILPTASRPRPALWTIPLLVVSTSCPCDEPAHSPLSAWLFSPVHLDTSRTIQVTHRYLLTITVKSSSASESSSSNRRLSCELLANWELHSFNVCASQEKACVYQRRRRMRMGSGWKTDRKNDRQSVDGWAYMWWSVTVEWGRKDFRVVVRSTWLPAGWLKWKWATKNNHLLSSSSVVGDDDEDGTGRHAEVMRVDCGWQAAMAVAEHQCRWIWEVQKSTRQEAKEGRHGTNSVTFRLEARGGFKEVEGRKWKGRSKAVGHGGKRLLLAVGWFRMATRNFFTSTCQHHNQRSTPMPGVGHSEIKVTALSCSSINEEKKNIKEMGRMIFGVVVTKCQSIKLVQELQWLFWEWVKMEIDVIYQVFYWCWKLFWWKDATVGNSRGRRIILRLLRKCSAI